VLSFSHKSLTSENMRISDAVKI